MQGRDHGAIRECMRMSHALWGGVYNPIISVDDRESASLILSKFQLDVLCGVSDGPEVAAFIEERALTYPRLSMLLEPFSGPGRRLSGSIDSTHAMRQMHLDGLAAMRATRLQFELQYRWADDDPLADVLLATIGDYPSPTTTEIDFRQQLELATGAQSTQIDSIDVLPPFAYRTVSPSAMSRYGLRQSPPQRFTGPGLYVGSAASMDDVVLFWNLCASGHRLVFIDLAQVDRLRNATSIWLHSQEPAAGATWTAEAGILCSCPSDAINAAQALDLAQHPLIMMPRDEAKWEYEAIRPVSVWWADSDVEAFVNTDDEVPTVTVQLADRPPFAREAAFDDCMVVSVSTLREPLIDKGYTLVPPHLPALNRMLGATSYFNHSAIRSEPDALGVIVNASIPTLYLKFIKSSDLIRSIFQSIGIKAELSAAGLVGTRLIQQMGGLFGCSYFRLPGLRRLIETHSPLRAFRRSAAIVSIRDLDPVTGKPQFARHEQLMYFARGMRRLTPESVFEEMLKRGVFRVGLEFTCPRCNLAFWISLDDAKTDVQCEYCGSTFRTAPFLKDRDWAYRRTGLFGREDHQEGSIPVALTLLKLAAIARIENQCYAGAMRLRSIGTASVNCETDLVFIAKGRFGGRPSLVIAECKTRDEVTQQDIDNLVGVAKSVPEDAMNAFVVLAKLTAFTAQEVDMIVSAVDQSYARIILFGPRELEADVPFPTDGTTTGRTPLVTDLDAAVRVSDRLYLSAAREARGNRA